MPNLLTSTVRAAAEGLVALVAAGNRLRLPGTAHPFVVGVPRGMGVALGPARLRLDPAKPHVYVDERRVEGQSLATGKAA